VIAACIPHFDFPAIFSLEASSRMEIASSRYRESGDHRETREVKLGERKLTGGNGNTVQERLVGYVCLAPLSARARVITLLGELISRQVTVINSPLEAYGRSG